MTATREQVLRALVLDLAAEAADLDARVATLADAEWSTPTPAAGWDILDTINHLRFFDRDALLAVSNPSEFGALVASLLDGAGDYVEQLTAQGRRVPPAEVLASWRAGRVALTDALDHVEPGIRVPWFGPAMSPASFITARLMETWAHGQDVVDALGQDRPATDRLRSVAEIGVRARAFSYAVHGLELPTQAVRVELTGPFGQTWTWGPDDAADLITGSALDFCLLVTQRRHRDDLALTASGAAAQEWMGIAQAFAGPPGGGREPIR